eukprot:gene13128-13258_t
MNTFSCIALVTALLVTALQVQAQAPSGAATLTIQFDNTKKSVVKPENDAAIRGAIAKYVFLVPSSQVKLESGIDQSGVLSSQAVVTYRATGPTNNGKTVLAKRPTSPCDRIPALNLSLNLVAKTRVGPTLHSNEHNCEANIKPSGFLGLFDSTLEKEVKKATSSWWPGATVKVQKASCAKK